MHVTESAKQVLFAQNIPIHFIIIYIISFTVWVMQYLSFIEFLRKFCVPYGAIFSLSKFSV